MNQNPKVGVAIIITKHDQVLLMRRKGLTAQGPGQHQAGIWILEKLLNNARHARQKKRLDWMSSTYDFEHLRMIYLSRRASIT